MLVYDIPNLIGSRAPTLTYRIYNIRTNILEESIYEKFNKSLETNRKGKDEESIDPSKKMERLHIQDKDKYDQSRIQKKPLDKNDLGKLPKSYKFVQDHPIDQIIREQVKIRTMFYNVAFISNDWANLHGSSLRR